MKFGASTDETTRVAMEAISLATDEEKKRIAAEKAAKKAAFDSEYDVGENPFMIFLRDQYGQ